MRRLDDCVSPIETGSFSAAAERPQVSQPALSRRIQTPEEWRGVTLIDGPRKPLQFTPVAAGNQATFRNLVARICGFRCAIFTAASDR